MRCAISGETCVEPVVSKNSGHIFEKSVIARRLKATGKCPITDEPLSVDELLAVVGCGEPSVALSSGSSVSRTLRTLQNEWDALMLECFELRKANDSLRRQLADNLYSRDAATRVIARLTDERDSARQALDEALALAQLRRDDADSAKTVHGEDVEMKESIGDAMADASIDKKEERLSAAITQKRPNIASLTSIADEGFADLIADCMKTLSDARKSRKRKKMDPSAFGSWQRSTQPIARAAAVDWHSEGQLLAVGCGDATALICDLTRPNVRCVVRGHSHALSSLAFVDSYTSSRRPALVTCSSDGQLLVWNNSEDGGDYDWNESALGALDMCSASERLFAVGRHPWLALCAAAWSSGWALVNVETSATLATASTKVGCFEVHVDGQLLAVAHSEMDGVDIWDVRSAQKAASMAMDSLQKRTLAVAFSHNGYNCYSGHSQGVVRCWDLRKPKGYLQTSNCFEDTPVAVKHLSVDHSANCVAATLSDGSVQVLNRKLKHVGAFKAENKATDALFVNDDLVKFVTVSPDSVVRYFAQ